MSERKAPVIIGVSPPQIGADGMVAVAVMLASTDSRALAAAVAAAVSAVAGGGGVDEPPHAPAGTTLQ